MSERTTIGGTVYESIGSSSSNLLLKCNGTARIQWGNKLIDLIKNGKIASTNNQEQLFVIQDVSEIDSEGIYIINDNQFSQLWIYKNGQKYDLSGANLYISTQNKQDITSEQKKQAIENLGLYYNTLDEVKQSGIQNGIVYILDTKELYTIKNGNIEEFEAKIKSVIVEEEKEEENGETINNDYKIILSISEDPYLILQDRKIEVNHSVYVKNTEQIGSELADSSTGYRLYMDGDVSCLDIDTINVRQGLPIQEYIEITYQNLEQLLLNNNLEPHKWYLLLDYQNPWKLLVSNEKFNRPILLRALTNSTFYTEGYLFKDRRVVINYDPTYKTLIHQNANETYSSESYTEVTARGLITWMKDSNGNESNFDFLDYIDVNDNAITTLYESSEDPNYLDKSIFPKNSYNNKLTVFDLKGIHIKDGIIDLQKNNEIEFLCAEMHDNTIVCNGLKIPEECNQFCFNTFKLITNTQFKKNVYNSIFETVIDCDFNNEFNKVRFKDLINCKFDQGILENVTCYTNIQNYESSSTKDTLLYDTTKIKSAYFRNNLLQVISVLEQVFFRGMIVMHAGNTEIPEGWAICDGREHVYEGVTTTTPNLIDKFIKANVPNEDNSGYICSASQDLDVNEKNELILQKEHLPEHNHPHHPHTHTITGTTVNIEESGNLSFSFNQSTNTLDITQDEGTAIITVGGEGITTDSGTFITNVSDSSQTNSKSVNITGGNHSHNGTVTEGTISESTSQEETQTWENKAIKIEPNYYSLIFIMKL